jgi:hypothetical protein
MKVVICIKRDDSFSHHRKLTIGGKYYCTELRDALSIYDLNENRIGSYSKELFVDIDIYREQQINEILN